MTNTRFTLGGLFIGVAGVALICMIAGDDIQLREQRRVEKHRLTLLIQAAHKIGAGGSTMQYGAHPRFYLANGSFDIRGGTLSKEAAHAISESPVLEVMFAGTVLSPEVDQILKIRFFKAEWGYATDPPPTNAGPITIYLDRGYYGSSASRHLP